MSDNPLQDVTLAPDVAAEFDQDDVVELRQGEANLPRPTEPDAERFARLRGKAGELPNTPGVYLMKDLRGVVIYVGKSRSLRNRVGSYFVPSASLGPVKQYLLEYVVDFDTLDCDSEVEALLMENRLIKDIQPRFNARLTDDKTFPYLEITTRDDFPGVYVTRQPRETGTRLYGPFTSVYALRQAVTHLQRVFKFRTCHLEISADDPKRRFFRPCLLHAIKQCTAPCADRVSPEAYGEDIDRLRRFMESKRVDVLREMTREMETASAALNFERAATLRDQIRALESLARRGDGDRDLQPEVFHHDYQAGLKQLREIIGMDEPIRSMEGVDIAHFQGEATVGSLVCFIDGRPFKNGYKRFRIKTVTGIDDYKCIQEVVSRRYRDAGRSNELFPDVILIDGGLGQLHAALEAFGAMDVKPPMVISLAKREEEVFIQARAAPVKLSRTSHALKLLQHIRDEAHRFAQNYHHLLISKRQFERLTGDPAGGKPRKRRGKKAAGGASVEQAPDAAGSAGAAQATELRLVTLDQIRALGAETKVADGAPTVRGPSEEI